MQTNKPLSHLDNDKEELNELTKLFADDIALRVFGSSFNALEPLKRAELVATIVKIAQKAQAHTQSKLKAFAGEIKEATPENPWNNKLLADEDMPKKKYLLLKAKQLGFNKAVDDINKALKAIKGKAGIE